MMSQFLCLKIFMIIIMKGKNYMKYEIWCDGASSNNGKSNSCGGWAYLIVKDGAIIKSNSGGQLNATNNQMELLSALNGLKEIEKIISPFDSVDIYSDSAYFINCVKQKWYKAWEKNGWKTASKQPVLNQNLWNELISYFDSCQFDFNKTKGHCGIKFNELVDSMAVAAREEVLKSATQS